MRAHRCEYGKVLSDFVTQFDRSVNPMDTIEMLIFVDRPVPAMLPPTPLFARFSVHATRTRRVLGLSAGAVLIGMWSFGAYAGGSGAGFGVSATVIHRILAQTPAGVISTLCDQATCPAPQVSVEPVDPGTGTRTVRVVY